MGVKHIDLKEDVKKVVNSLVGKRIERLEKTIESNQQTIDNNVKNLEKDGWQICHDGR